MVWIAMIAGFALLIAGAEGLVRGASGLAVRFGVPPLVIGLTVVAYGTSAPEAAVAVFSALAGKADISIGNAVGSNIFNVLFVLGVSALVAPLTVSHQLVRLDVPLMIAASFLLLFFGMDGIIGRFNGLILISGAVIYTLFLVHQSRKENQPDPTDAAQAAGARHWATDGVFVVAGLVLLVIGSRLLVSSSVAIAQRLGISELIIGLTIVAAGTSLPEVATSIIAALRGQRDIAVGNVVGSNIFNILMVLGLAGLVTPGGIGVSEAALRFDIPVMIAVAAACLPIFFTGHVISRWEGALFLGYYGAYTLFIVLASLEHAALHLVSIAMLVFVIPLTVLTLLVVAFRAIRSQ